MRSTSRRSCSPRTIGRATRRTRAPPGQASPRDNVVFEAGLFGGALGMRRTFILHAKGAKLPTDLLGMTAVRYPDALTPADMREREPEAPEGDRGRGPRCPARGRLVAALAHASAPSASRRRSVSCGSRATATAASRSPAEAGRRTARSRRATGARPRRSIGIRSSVFYYFKGERPRHPNAPQIEGTGEIRLEDDRSGFWLLEHPVGQRSGPPRTDGRRLPARRSSGHGHPRRRRSVAERRAAGHPARGMEDHLELLMLDTGRPCPG